MLELYNVIEYGHRTVFLNRQARGDDVYHLLSLAIRAAGDNGGNITAALAGVQNSNGFYPELLPQAHPLRQLDAEEAEEYDRERDVNQRVTIDLDRGVLTYERSSQGTCARQGGQQPIPEDILVLYQQAREIPVIRLRDLVLLGLPPVNVYLVHKQSDIGIIPASSLRELTDRGQAEFADLLNAKVEAIRPGTYGVELVMTGILPGRLEDFDQAQAAMLWYGLYEALKIDQAPEQAEEQTTMSQ